MTPDAARESLYRRLYAAWPEWTDPGDLSEGGCFHAGLLYLRDWGRIEVRNLEHGIAVRVNMRLAA